MDDLHDHPVILDFKNKFSLIGQEVDVKNLYQYTYSSTISSLLRSKVIWATSHKNLNDPTELQHGMSFFLNTLEGFLKQISPSDFYKFIAFFEKQSLQPRFKIFIASFTPNKDLLSQWRGYGDQGKGLSIGFKPSEFKLDEDKTSFWLKVIYDDKQKANIVSQIYNDLLLSIAQLKKLQPQPSAAQIVEAIMLALIQVALINAARFKDKSWSEEEEWRLVKLHFGQKGCKPVQVRNREHDLIEYYEMDFKTDSGSALSEVVIGPRSNKINQRSALETLLDKYTVSLTDSVISWV